MAWWREAKFGMFIHWGLYAVPAGVWQDKNYGGIGEWIMHDAKIPVADYKKLTAQFNPVQFDADAWVAVAKAAGMKYIVITAKHHDGFAMFDSKADPFNIVAATPFKRDPLKELAAACQKQGIKLGFYYSQDQDWTSPGGAAFGGHWDKAQDGDFSTYLHTKAIPQLKELLNNYQPAAPAVIWFDTPTKDMTPALAQEIVALLKQHPGLIWNNRLGGGDKGDTETPEQHIPPQGFPGRDWETCMTINNTWGFKKNDFNWKSTETLLRNLVDIVSKGGNYLLNVGPTAEGIIPQPEIDRLQAVGAWLKVNGEAIYDAHGSPFPKALPWGRVTQKDGRLYLHIFNWPADGKLVIPMTTQVKKAWLLSAPTTPLTSQSTEQGISIQLPPTAPDAIASVVALEIAGPVNPLPPPPLAQADDNSITLPADEAELLNSEHQPVTAKLEESSGKTNIGYWTDVHDYAQWKVDVKHPGTFNVAIDYASESSGEKNEFVLSINGQPVAHGVIASTGSWKKYTIINTEALTISQPGIVAITLKSGGPATKTFLNLRSITFTR